ncbi:recombinase RecT [Enterococcus faecalis]|uniref:recombinase RecT n=1 Tax=Enterococcus faecalis TaxID=1351 RepID=UPI0040428672
MTNNTNELAVLQKDITDIVLGKVAELESQGVQLPQNYNAANALKQAFFKINEAEISFKNGGGLYMEKYGNTPAGKASVANALLDMIQQGLNPGKNQCYFIVYGAKLQLSRSYFGTQVALKRLGEIKDVWANVVYEGDEFEIEMDRDREVLKIHKTSFLNKDNPIIGAYCVVEKADGEKVLTVMTKKQIDTSWGKAKTDKVQKEFPEEMAKRTVINRAAKAFINTSDDSDLMPEAFNRTTENDYDYSKDKPTETAQSLTEKFNYMKQAEKVEEPATTETNALPENTTLPAKEVPDMSNLAQEQVEITDKARTDDKGHEVTTYEGHTGYIAPDIQEYFEQEYAKSGVKVVPGHWPSMETEAEVDHWLEGLQMMEAAFEEFEPNRSEENITEPVQTDLGVIPEFGREEGINYGEETK